MKSPQPTLWILPASMAIVIAMTTSFVSAWTGPTQTAPNGNTPQPISTSSASQVKAGNFWASAIGSTGGFCITISSCITTWPTTQWTIAGTNVYYTTGNVGIGTNAPLATLDINGVARLTTQTVAPIACDAAHKGSIAYASSARLCVCNGSSWQFDYNGAACAWNVSPGSQNYTTPGSYSGATGFTVPTYNTLTVKVWGGGGGASGSADNSGLNGNQSSWNGVVVANGGIAGKGSGTGTGGTASGGDTNTTGGNGTTPNGGNAPNGGSGGGFATNGVAPGGGGGSGKNDSTHYGGGSGGYSIKTYTVGTLTPGTSISVVVGAGGVGGTGTPPGGSGAPGAVNITWN